MNVCTYDNPATMCRECWQDGKLVCHYSARLLAPFATHHIPPDRYFFGANIGPWDAGRIVGSKDAFPSNSVLDRSVP